MIKVFVGCVVLNILVGLSSYLTLDIHRWQILTVISLANAICLLAECSTLLKNRSLENKILGVGFARNIFYVGAIMGMKFNLDVRFGLVLFFLGFIGSFLIFYKKVPKGEAVLLSAANTGALLLALSLIPWNVSESKVSSQFVKKYPGRGALKNFERYSGQVGVLINGTERHFNIRVEKPEYTLIEIKNTIGGSAYFLE